MRDVQNPPAGHHRGAHRSDEGTTTGTSVSPAVDLPSYAFRHVDTRPTRQVVQAVAVHADGTRHEVGHLPSEGWWCSCPRGKRCSRIAGVRQLVPGIPGGA